MTTVAAGAGHRLAPSDPASSPVPGSYAELYERYIALTVTTVVRAGIHRQDADDVAHEILMRIIARDLLPTYDPNLRHTLPDGRVRTARFATWLAGIVKVYARHYRDRQIVADARRATLDLTIYDGDDDIREVERRGVLTPDHADGVAATLDRDRIVTALDTVPVRGSRDLGAALRFIADQLDTSGTFSRTVLAAQMGVSTSTAHNIIADLQDHLTARGLTPAAILDARNDDSCFEVA